MKHEAHAISRASERAVSELRSQPPDHHDLHATHYVATNHDPAARRTTYLRKSMLMTSVDPKTCEYPIGQRFLLWIDAVGGYLVCLGDTVTLGQPEIRRHVDVPILGDLSTRHVKIRRDAEGYTLEVRRPIRIDGRPIETATTLAKDCELEIGAGVRFRFRRPHALSNSAQLLPKSRHRTQPSTDAVLLMAESLILGPSPACHVQCPAWSREVIFLRKGGELWCQTAGPLEIDGKVCKGSGRLTFDSHVTGEDFSLSLEAL